VVAWPWLTTFGFSSSSRRCLGVSLILLLDGDLRADVVCCVGDDCCELTSVVVFFLVDGGGSKPRRELVDGWVQS
jgi:hypothetical protein